MLKTGIALALIAAAVPQAANAQETRATYDRDVIIQAEIQDRARDAKTAYDVVTRLRPHFLRERSSGTAPGPVASRYQTPQAERQPVQVYVNGGKTSAPNISLREINASSIIEIVYLNSADATTRFGTGHNNGAILVKTGI